MYHLHGDTCRYIHALHELVNLFPGSFQQLLGLIDVGIEHVSKVHLLLLVDTGNVPFIAPQVDAAETPQLHQPVILIRDFQVPQILQCPGLCFLIVFIVIDIPDQNVIFLISCFVFDFGFTLRLKIGEFLAYITGFDVIHPHEVLVKEYFGNRTSLRH